MIKFYSWH